LIQASSLNLHEGGFASLPRTKDAEDFNPPLYDDLQDPPVERLFDFSVLISGIKQLK
jgi:hypothetical protein